MNKSLANVEQISSLHVVVLAEDHRFVPIAENGAYFFRSGGDCRLTERVQFIFYRFRALLLGEDFV